MNKKWQTMLAVGLATAWVSLSAVAADLPALNIDLKQTTVSGISSGAFMAVQMGVAKSSFVRGVAVTAGGPYLCALDNAYSPTGVSGSIARCMEGDPSFRLFASVKPLSDADLDDMARRTKNLAKWKKIDPVEHLASQAVWVFHGYNDGIVKLPVSQGLISWYQKFTPASQVFHKDNLNAAHAQISAACSASTAASAAADSCNICSTTGGKFINSCQDQPAAPNNAPYDAAGSALQMFYGPLTRTDTARLSAKPQAFSQMPFLKLYGGTSPVESGEVAMSDTGYLYVPQACQAGQSGPACRLHIAFHGCMQSATTIGTSFVDNGGVNEWADANRIVVLYPQAMPTNFDVAHASLKQPVNPMGCWDWWGYNDNVARFPSTPGGAYATSEGLQIAAVWRMAEKLAAQGKPGSFSSPVAAAGTVPQLLALDQSATQVMLRWQPVTGATGYRVYRSSGTQAAKAIGTVTAQSFWTDTGLSPATAYRYTVRAVVSGKEGQDSNAVSVSTSRVPPACDPYFSLAKNTPVDKYGEPTKAVCD